MKLSDLVNLRSQIDLVFPTQAKKSFYSCVNPVTDIVRQSDLGLTDLIEKIDLDIKSVCDGINQFDQSIQEFKNEIQNRIDAMQPTYFSNSYRRYEESLLLMESADYKLNRQLTLTEEVEQFIKSRVQMYSTWQHAGMIIRPGIENWIKDMVACDPLYLLDTDHDMLEPAKKHFNPIYNNRLRWYTINENNIKESLSLFPENQIGFCFCYNFFHFKPFEIVKNYIESIYHLLSPGGVFVMTFNDCDRTGGVRLAENNFMSFIPGIMLENLCTSMGFEIKYRKEIDASTTWIELAKPGKKKSLRGGQTLAKIVDKPAK